MLTKKLIGKKWRTISICNKPESNHASNAQPFTHNVFVEFNHGDQPNIVTESKKRTKAELKVLATSY